MKLIFTPNVEYVHKVLVTAFEAGIHGRIEFERTRPFEDNTTVWNYNPFGKVPCLIMDNGEPLYGGLYICEYIDSLAVAGTTVFPKDESRWRALRRAALGDGMFDATTLLRVEGWRDRKDWNLSFMLRERRKIMNALDRMEVEAPHFAAAKFDIGHICMAGGISYLNLRNPIREHELEAGDAQFDWRAGRPNLSAWYDAAMQRPSLQYKVTLPGSG